MGENYDKAVFAFEMMVIALQWVEKVRPDRVVIELDSCTELMCLKFCNSRSREFLRFEILFRIH